jgi:NADPH:quinone reductase-like Zn-dependent oxidoreductase
MNEMHVDGPQRMMALRAHARGGPEQLVYEESPRPAPAGSEILVAVGAAAITFAELTWPETWEANGVDRTPVIPSHEFAGVVAEVGPDVEDLAVGDAVFGLVPFNRDGAAAEYVVVPASSAARKPQTVPDPVAAAAALPALTAWEALNDHAQLAAGQTILIHGGSGAVGAFLTQFAHGLGAHVTVTVRSASAEQRARALGAEHVIVTDGGAVPAKPSFDVAIDAVGGDTPEWLYASVRADGRLITLQEPPNQELATAHGLVATFFVVSTRRDRLEELAALMANGNVEVAIAQTTPLSAGRAAYESGDRPKAGPGKTVLLVAQRSPTTPA